MMYPEGLNRARKHSYYILVILVVDQIIVRKYSFLPYLHFHGHSVLPRPLPLGLAWEFALINIMLADMITGSKNK